MPRWVKGAGGRAVNGGRAGGAPKAPRVKVTTHFDLIGDWQKAMRSTRALQLDSAIEQAVRQEAALAEKVVKQNLTRGGAPTGSPLKAISPWTRAARKLANPAIKGSKPLIARGDLRNGITHVIEGSKRETKGFVGVLRQAKNGEHLVNIAGVQEFGKTIVVRITDKMRRFLAVLAKAANLPKRPGGGKGTGKRFLVIHIPARPFIRPAFEFWAKDAPDRFAKRISILTKGALGS